MKNSTTVLLGILGAATAGVIIGMLIAPEKGEDLRRNIAGGAKDFARKLTDLISQGKDHVEEVASKAMDEADEFQNEIATAGANSNKKMRG